MCKSMEMPPKYIYIYIFIYVCGCACVCVPSLVQGSIPFSTVQYRSRMSCLVKNDCVNRPNSLVGYS